MIAILKFLSDGGVMKRCFKCGEEKEITEFYRHPQMGDGHLGKCKNCTKRDVQQNYDVKFEYYREYERKRFKLEERKQKLIEYQRDRREINPHKYKARYTVSNAIRDGRMERQPCEICGAPDAQTHHDDYSKPLDVRWLCFVHHRELHGQKNVARGREKQEVP
jgi:hypothetical protein